ncbi:hypothetical protein GQ43DRAFT_435565 [Delitschia confertaspora ATCC 74209]|uniref:Uncharacterized protein n=1 Tax=Delitschia confertaspora ATCC 74209 TaxID=1513339 RepID=A0A9P4JI70_9PLEO|nr:hypothetical protein GQ43DRAFT_435565 [Delitschia confertaspora ATCC 74209]
MARQKPTVLLLGLPRHDSRRGAPLAVHGLFEICADILQPWSESRNVRPANMILLTVQAKFSGSTRRHGRNKTHLFYLLAGLAIVMGTREMLRFASASSSMGAQTSRKRQCSASASAAVPGPE